MQKAADDSRSNMVAVINLVSSDVERLCKSFDGIYAANYNCPGQTVVACHQTVFSAFSTAVREAGGRVVKLNVSGGFHSPYMTVAAHTFATILESVSFGEPIIPVYANSTGSLYKCNIRETLSSQMYLPVLWENCIRNILNDGVDTFIEVGPGRVLSQLITRINKHATCFSVETYEDIIQTVQKVKNK